MSLNIDAKSVAIGGAAVLVATQLFGGSKTSSKSVNGLGKPASKRKASGTKKKASTAKTKKSTASKSKSKK